MFFNFLNDLIRSQKFTDEMYNRMFNEYFGVPYKDGYFHESKRIAPKYPCEAGNHDFHCDADEWCYPSNRYNSRSLTTNDYSTVGSLAAMDVIDRSWKDNGDCYTHVVKYKEPEIKCNEDTVKISYKEDYKTNDGVAVKGTYEETYSIPSDADFSTLSAKKDGDNVVITIKKIKEKDNFKKIEIK